MMHVKALVRKIPFLFLRMFHFCVCSKNYSFLKYSEWRNQMASGILRDCRMSILENLKYTRRACGHGDMGTGPQEVFAATLTLFQPVGDRLCPPNTDFESHRHMVSRWQQNSTRTTLQQGFHSKKQSALPIIIQRQAKVLKTGSDKIILWLGRYSFLMGFIMSKKLERLRTELLIRM